MNHSISIYSKIAVFVVISGCAPESEEPLSVGAAPASLSVRVPSVAGYQHNLSRSKFHIGSGVVTSTEGNLVKMIGSDGVFSTNVKTGTVVATLNSGSSIFGAAPYASGGTAHNQQVRDYFIAAGLPADQIGFVSLATGQRGSWAGGLPNSSPRFVGYSSALVRVIKGIEVVDSLAMAEFNANGDVVAEAVFWPDVPQRTVDDANSLVAILSDPTGKAKYLAGLPVQAASGRVVIRHTSGAFNAPFEAFASFDVTEQNHVRHFDVGGNELRTPQERAPGKPTPR